MSKLSDAVKDIEISAYKNADFKSMILDEDVQRRVCELLDNLDFEASAVVKSLADMNEVVYYVLKIGPDSVFADKGWTSCIFLRIDDRFKNQIAAFHSNIVAPDAISRWVDEANLSLSKESCELTEFNIDRSLYENLVKYLDYRRVAAENSKEAAFSSTESFEAALQSFRSNAI